MHNFMTLSDLPPGESGFVAYISAQPAMEHRLADLGLVSGTQVTCLARSPSGDPCAYLIRGSLIALRAADADGIHLTRSRTEASDS